MEGQGFAAACAGFGVAVFLRRATQGALTCWAGVFIFRKCAVHSLTFPTIPTHPGGCRVHPHTGGSNRCCCCLVTSHMRQLLTSNGSPKRAGRVLNRCNVAASCRHLPYHWTARVGTALWPSAALSAAHARLNCALTSLQHSSWRRHAGPHTKIHSQCILIFT